MKSLSTITCGCKLLSTALFTIASLATVSAQKNIIIFIGDGMGFEHVQAGRLYSNGNDTTPLTFESVLLPYHGSAITKLPDGTITDSATAGTALATGYQHPASGVISMGADNSIKTTILEMAKAKGLRTGIITTDSISGATPGAFGAHEPNRTLELDIRLDYLRDDTTDYPHPASRPNVLFGGGSSSDSTYVGLAASLGYSLAGTSSELEGLQPTAYALGLFGSWAPMDSFVANNATQPRLPVMVNKALTLLENNSGAGFFLMVEGALIDKLSHSNDPNFTPEVAELDLAVQQAFAWVRQSGQPTLVIVTADHETGGLSVPDGQTVTPGTIPTMTFSSTSHTGADVPVYANWPAGLHGQTIDNTEIFYLMEDYLEDGKAPQITDHVASGITETEATIQWTTTELSDSKVEVGGTSFGSAARVSSHQVKCTGLQPGTTYAVTVSSTDLAGWTGTATVTFTTVAPTLDAVVKANPVSAGTLVGGFEGTLTPNDGVTQSITEVQDGAGSGLEVIYTLNTIEPRSQVTALSLYGSTSWTEKDGSSDALVTEVRVFGPAGSEGWQRITLNATTPFVASPPSSYIDESGNILIRFTDSAAIKRERKDTLTVDYLVGKVDSTGGPVEVVTAPGNPAAVADSSTAITLTWDDSSNETGYDIWRYTDTSGWVVAASLSANTTTYADTGLAPLTTYTYVVRAYNNQSYADSESTSATTGAQELEMVENFTAKAGRGVINLSWTDTNSSESGYEVLRDGNVIKVLEPNSAKYADSAVVKGTTYTYQVRPVNGDSVGPVTTPISVTAR